MVGSLSGYVTPSFLIIKTHFPMSHCIMLFLVLSHCSAVKINLLFVLESNAAEFLRSSGCKIQSICSATLLWQWNQITVQIQRGAFTLQQCKETWRDFYLFLHILLGAFPAVVRGGVYGTLRLRSLLRHAVHWLGRLNMTREERWERQQRDEMCACFSPAVPTRHESGCHERHSALCLKIKGIKFR